MKLKVIILVLFFALIPIIAKILSLDSKHTSTEISSKISKVEKADSVSLSSWDVVGDGVMVAESSDKSATKIAICAGGMGSKMRFNNRWAEALFYAKLKDLHVKYLYSIQGPVDEFYLQQELGITALSKSVLDNYNSISNDKGVKDDIIVISHSSGVFPIYAMLDLLYLKNMDARGITKGKIHFFCLEGDTGELGGAKVDPDCIEPLGKLYAVYAYDKSTNTYSSMRNMSLSLKNLFPEKCELVEIDASKAGCLPGAEWCLHDAVIITRPYNPAAYDLDRDYAGSSSQNPVETRYLDYYKR